MRTLLKISSLIALLLIGTAHANDMSNSTWSETDASNNSSSPNGWTSGTMRPNEVEPTARAMMGALKRWYNHTNATATSGGSANAQTLTYSVAPAAYVSGDTYAFVPGYTNTGATTLNVNGLGAKSVKIGQLALVGGEIVGGNVAVVYYDGTNFQLMKGRSLSPGNFYVNRSTGSDSNDCLSATVSGSHGPCLTIPHAASVALAYDANKLFLLLNVAAGTYPEPLLVAGSVAGSGCKPIGSTNCSVVGGALYILGAGSGTTLMDITTADGCTPYPNAITASQGMDLFITGIELSTTCANGSGLFVQNLAMVTVGADVKIGASTVQQIHNEALGFVEISPNGITFAGNATQMMAASDNAYIEVDPTATITCAGAATYSNATLLAQNGGTIHLGTTVSFSGCGSITAPRYVISGGSIVIDSSALSTFIPGNSTGFRYYGGRYQPSSQTAPTLSSCGTSPSITGGDDSGIITVGGGGVTSCTMTYAYPTANQRYCTASSGDTLQPVAFSSQTATSAVFATASSMSGTLIRYNCTYPY